MDTSLSSRTGPLAGRVAIVTGAGGGIGRGIAMELARQGAAVIANDIGADLLGGGADAGPAETVAGEIRRNGGISAADTTSITSWDGARSIIGTAVERFGRLDILVNNAGILRDRIFHKLAPSDWHAVIDVHLHGSFYMARAAAEPFRAQGSGRMVFMTSASGLIGNFGQANYAAAKLAVVGLAKSVALDMARYGVTANCVCPFAWTRMADSIPAITPEEQTRIEKLKRMEPGKIAPLVAYLATEGATDTTGQIFAVRANEIFLMGQSRPLRSVHRAEGWTAEAIAEQAIPALRPHFYPLDRSADVFGWDPI